MLLLFLVVLVVALASFPGPMTKLRALARGLYYTIWSRDFRKDLGTTFFRAESGTPTKERTVRVIFVRHGQSYWNSIVNKFGPLWPVRFVRFVVVEWLLFWWKPRHSLLIDSPLSPKGLQEAKTVSDFVRTSKDISLDAKTSMVVTSNLRRAIETAVIGFGPRLQQTGERVFVDSLLQEVTRQIDAQSFSSTPGKLCDTPIQGIASREAMAKLLDPAYNLGNKDINSNVVSRTAGFVSRLFDLGGVAPYAPLGSRNDELKTIIVVGHSMWFLSFFRRFLPKSSEHIAKKKKMRNGAVVAFELKYNGATGEVSIDEKSINALFLGFA